MPEYELKDRIKQLRETEQALKIEIENVIPKENIHKILYLKLCDLDSIILCMEREFKINQYDI